MNTVSVIRCEKCRKIIGEFKIAEGRIKCKCGHMNVLKYNIGQLQNNYRKVKAA